MLNHHLRNWVLEHPWLKPVLFQWEGFLAVILKNAGSLVGTQLVTSALGFFYWWLAARSFSPQIVGLASGSISAMLLLGATGVMGFGTLLMGIIRREREQAGDLVASALVVVGLVGAVIGLLFVWSTTWIASEFEVWAANFWNVLLFAFNVGLTSAVLVLDQVLIGLLRGSLQLWRNTIFALVKLVALFAISLWLSEVSGITIYSTWMIGNFVSIIYLGGVAIQRRERIFRYRPRMTLLRRLGVDALIHHSLNMALQAPGLALPVIVTILLSAQSNAYFYASWMIASFVFVGPIALATVLYAVSSTDAVLLSQKFRLTLRLSLLIGVCACAGLWIAADPVLRIFGSDYANQGAWALRILSLAVFPMILKNLYVALYRIQGRILAATRIVILGSFLELFLAAAGGKTGGLVGLSAGWVLAVMLEGLIMFRPVVQFLRAKAAPDGQL